MVLVSPGSLELVDHENVDEHVFELLVNRSASERDLGILDKRDRINISIDGQDLDIKQSISMLNTSSSSTGAVAWRVSPLIAEWLVSDLSIFGGLSNKDLAIVELGSGVAGIVAAVAGPKVGRFIATDQKHILKLCRQNIQENVASLSSKSHIDQISVLEYDWEYAEQMVQGLPLKELHDNYSERLVIACDTIYNDYLIPYFIKALKLVVEKLGDDTMILIAQQLRSEQIMESVLNQLLQAGFVLYNIPEERLTKELQTGYAVHYLSYKS